MHIKEIENINIKHKEKYAKAFRKLLNQIKENKFDFKNHQEKDYLIFNEERLDSHFIHIVPKELMPIFNKIRKDNPNDFLGLSILVGKKQEREVRLSCFGIPCHILTKEIIS